MKLQEAHGYANSELKTSNSAEDQSVEYVSEQLDVKGSVLEAFSEVIARFQLPPEEISVRL
jgi:splicing factor 3B subunit 2